MDQKQQNLGLLRQRAKIQAGVPWPGVQGDYWPRARDLDAVRQALHELGGMAGDWYAPHQCHYYTAQRVATAGSPGSA